MIRQMNAAARRRERLSRGFAQRAAAAVSGSAELDIAEIRHFPVREPASGNRYSLLSVKTRSELTGWGECGAISGEELKELESAWKGRPASRYAAIDASTPAAGALDRVLLDILGKACRAPVYRPVSRSAERGQWRGCFYDDGSVAEW
jgi:hypothetical protein